MQRLKILVLILLGLAAVAAAQAGPGEIAGTIRLNGCTAKPADLQLRASPVSFYTPAEGSRVAAPQVAAIANIRASGESGQEFTFRVSGGEQPGAYRLGIRLTSPNCPQVAWTGPTDGLVFTGGAPVTLEAFAINTQIEILGEGMGRPGPKWVGADNLDFTDPAVATRRLRVRSTLPGLTNFLLQLSTQPFPTSGRTACEVDPPEVIRSVQFSAGLADIGDLGTPTPRPLRPGEWLELPPINFNALLQDGGGSSSDPWSIDPSTLQQLELGAPLHLRVLPVGIDPQRPSDGAVRLCDPGRFGLAGWARVAKLVKILASLMPVDDPKGAIRLYSAAYKYPEIDMSVPGKGKACYSVTQYHTVDTSSGSYDLLLAIGKGLVNGTQLKPGDGPYCFDCCASNDGWFEMFTGAVGDLVTGAIDWMGALVNWAAKVYDSIKKAVGDVVVNAINTVPPGGICDSDFCHGLVQKGIEIGLSSMGMPPSLPNWDELKEQGLEYVAGQIASQTDIPGMEQVSAKALEYATATIEKVTEKRGGDPSGTLPNWLMRDYGYKPAYLMLTLQKMKVGQLTPPYILHTSQNEAFFPSKLPLPKEFPDKVVNWQTLKLLQVPIVLNPNLSELPPNPYCGSNNPTCSGEWAFLWYKGAWAGTVLTGNPCVRFFATYYQELEQWPALKYGPPYGLGPLLFARVYSFTPFDPPLPFGVDYLCVE